jgi:(p)ppGpp synthase/HD superfamily hydrolase
MIQKPSLELRSMVFAHTKHKGQKDSTGKSYILHPLRVYHILCKVTKDENVRSAGLLHDTLEDTNTTYTELKTTFNKKIADLVLEVTHKGTKGAYYFPKLKSREAILIKYADRLDNLSRMENWTPKRRKAYLDKSVFWKKYK